MRIQNIIILLLGVIAIMFVFTSPCSARNYDCARSGVYQDQDNKIITHIVKKRESLYSILKKYKMSLSNFIKSNNKFSNSDLKLTIGERLFFEKKYIGTATNSEISRQINSHPETIILKGDSVNTESISIEKDSVISPNIDVEKEQYISDLSLADKYISIHQSKQITPLKSWDKNIKIAILLPLTDSGNKIDSDFESFYKGAVLALDSLKKMGISAIVQVYDTGKGLEVVNELIYGGLLDDMNIIIGPIYNDQFTLFAEHLKGKGIILVSPLAVVESDYDFIYQVAPSNKSRFDKIKDNAKDKNILFYSHGDSENETFFINIIKDAPEVNALEYDNEMEDEDIIKYFSKDISNLVVISSNKKNDIEILLSKVMSIKNKFQEYDIEVIGSPEFGRIDESKRADFFRANTHFITSYHYDRQNKQTLKFETEYIDMFGEVPTLYSYRAYDVMMMFVNMMNIYGDSFKENINDQLTRILQVNYRFIQERSRGKNINQEWMLVNYRPNYKITTK